MRARIVAASRAARRERRRPRVHRDRWRAMAAVTSAMTIWLSACGITGRDCTLEFVPAVEVTVIDAATELAVGDSVTVVVRDDGFEEMLVQSTSNVFSGAGERPGEYVVVVTHPRYEPWVRDQIRVTEGGCHVRTAYLTAELVAR